MRRKLGVFTNEHITNKNELLYSLAGYREHCLCDGRKDAEWSEEKIVAIVSLIDKLITLVEKSKLPDLDDWWYYNYRFDGFDLVLELCHCESFNDSDWEPEMTTDEIFVLLSVPSKMLSILEFAQKYHVQPLTVRQWIRRGKLRAVKKEGQNWYISELADKPSRKYEAVTYMWDETILSLSQQFPYLVDYNYVYMKQDTINKNNYNLFLGAQGTENRKTICLTKNDREKLELALLSNANVKVEVLSDCIRFVPNIREVPFYAKIAALEKEDPIKSSDLFYGDIIITKGRYKGRIGYYDDDDKDAIVYFGDPLITDNYYDIKHDWLSNTIPTIKIIDRIENLYKDIHRTKHNPYKQRDLLLELNYCTNLLNDRYLNAMNKIQKDDMGCIFISHATNDLAFARAMATDLMEAGYSVFLDDWSIDLGEDIISRISDSLDSSHSLIMLISESYLKSVFCNDEWTAFYISFAKERKDSIYPVILDESRPPALLASKKYIRINNSNDYRNFLEKLLRALAKHTLNAKEEP